MSTRGLKYNFVVGELVLCFEPDPTKAKVLYDAKILDLQSLRDKDGKKIPGYHIHFQGWNSSWDRIVSEEFILKGTEENRILMKKLADTARKNQSKEKRKRKIEQILKRAFDGGNSSSSDDEDDDDDDDDDDGRNDVDSGDEDGDSDEDEKESNISDSPIVPDYPPQPKRPTHEPVTLDIPDVLKSRLEDDFFLINHKDKIVKLPVRPNVIEILESFVRNYCLNCLCELPEREKSKSNSSDSWHLAPGRWIPLCKEMVDGIRICFDFTLPLILLYGKERDQYQHTINNITLSQLRHENRVLTPTDQNSKRPRKFSPQRRPPHENDEDSSSEDLTPRRITRRSIAEESPKFTPRGRKVAARSKRIQSTPVSLPLEIKVEPNSDSEIVFNVQSTNHVPCNKHSVSNGNGFHHQDNGHQDGRSEMMESLMSWQLLPTEIQNEQPIKPSQIYGIQHLLRLFVKLPSLLNDMNLDEPRTQILMKLVDSCLQYVAERDDLFNEEIYVDS